MLVSVDKKYEQFLCEALKEFSTFKDENVKGMCFVVLTDKDVYTVIEDMSPFDMGIVATNLQMRANYDFVLENMVKYNEEDYDDTSESED